MEEWKEYKLGEILAEKGYIRGPFGSALKRGDMKSSGIPVYEQQHAIYQSRDFRFFIDDNKFNEMKRFQVQENDILISCSGTVGKVTIISKDDPKGIISQALLTLRVNPKLILPEYLKYFFTSQKGYNAIISRSSGSVQVNIAKRDVIEQIPINLPPLPTQQKIAAILSSLDDKIELNNKINENLEQQAQALFKSWFVDFEPFGGKRPENWKEDSLGNICECVLGGTPSRVKKDYWNGNIPWINSGEVNLFRIIEPSEYITNEGLIHSATKLLPKKTTVIAITGATLGQVSLLEIDSCANQSVVGIIPNECLPYVYIYPMINERIKELILNQTGGAQQHINKQNVQSLLINLPTKEILDNFEKKVLPIYETIANNCFENKNLALLRDFLLPKLMNGEIEV